MNENEVDLDGARLGSRISRSGSIRISGSVPSTGLVGPRGRFQSQEVRGEVSLVYPRDRLLGIRDGAVLWEERSRDSEAENCLSPAESGRCGAYDDGTLQRESRVNIISQYLTFLTLAHYFPPAFRHIFLI